MGGGGYLVAVLVSCSWGQSILPIQNMLQALSRTQFQQQADRRGGAGGVPADHDQLTNHTSATLLTEFLSTVRGSVTKSGRFRSKSPALLFVYYTQKFQQISEP